MHVAVMYQSSMTVSVLVVDNYKADFVPLVSFVVLIRKRPSCSESAKHMCAGWALLDKVAKQRVMIQTHRHLRICGKNSSVVQPFLTERGSQPRLQPT